MIELRAESERLTIRNAELSATLAQTTESRAQLERAERDKSTQVTPPRPSTPFHALPHPSLPFHTLL